MGSIAHGVSLHISRYLENTRSLWALLGLIKLLIPELKNDVENCYGPAIFNIVSPRSSAACPVRNRRTFLKISSVHYASFMFSLLVCYL